MDDLGSQVIAWTGPEKEIFRKKPPMLVSQHAEKNRMVTKGSKKGPWRNENAPYAVKPMDTFQLPWVRKVVLVWGPQTAKTQVAFNCIDYLIEYDPDDILYVMSTEKTAKKISKRQIKDLLKTSKSTQKYLTGLATDEATLSKVFKHGMTLDLAWATSAAELASESYKYAFFDETGKYPKAAAGDNQDPVYLGEVRTTAFPDTKKLLYFSTPTEENDAIMRAESEADEKWRYKVRCPHCGRLQYMVWENIVWPDGKGWKYIKRKRLARYQCENCPMDWTDADRNKAVRAGEWVCENPVDRPAVVAFHLPSWYSLFVSLSDVAGNFLQGKHDKAKHKIHITQDRAEPWKNIVVTSTEEKILKARCALDPQLVPADAVALSAGVDLQKRGFWFVVRAWAKDFTSWLIHYDFLSTYGDLEKLLFDARYPIQDSDREMGIWRAALDTGGGGKYQNMSMTEEAYWWLRQNQMGRGCRVWGTKGSSRPLAGKVHMTKPLDKTPSGKPLPGGLQIVTLDTDKIKDMVYYRLDQAAEQAAYAAYLHNTTGKDYARQILAEEKQEKKGHVTWIQTRADNHLLDCEGLAHIVVDPEWPGGGLNLLRVSSGQAKKAAQPKQAPAAGRPGNWLQNSGRPARPAWLKNR